MLSPVIRVLPLILLLVHGLAAEESAERTWRNRDGSKSFSGCLVSRGADEVTIRRTDGHSFTIAIASLHDDDRRWLERRARAESEAELQPAGAVFDTIRFGDTRHEVEAKLRESKLVEATVEETLFGRFGMNGTYRTCKPVGELHCELFFDWTDDHLLREVTLQTEGQPRERYPVLLRTTWSDLGLLLTNLHGQPRQAAAYPPVESLTDGTFLASHLWHLPGGGTAMLGTARQNGLYQVLVRFTQERIEPGSGAVSP